MQNRSCSSFLVLIVCLIVAGIVAAAVLETCKFLQISIAANVETLIGCITFCITLFVIGRNVNNRSDNIIGMSNATKEGRVLTQKCKILWINLEYWAIILFVLFVISAITEGDNFGVKKSELTKDADFVHGFVSVNTVFLKEYCSDSGYTPNKYINLFDDRFKQVVTYRNDVYEKYSNDYEIKKLTQKFRPEALKILNKNLIDAQREDSSVSKYDLCKYYDDNASQIVNEKVIDLQKVYPHLLK